MVQNLYEGPSINDVKDTKTFSPKMQANKHHLKYQKISHACSSRKQHHRHAHFHTRIAYAKIQRSPPSSVVKILKFKAQNQNISIIDVSCMSQY